MRRRHELGTTAALLLAAAALGPTPAGAQEAASGVNTPEFCVTLGELVSGACGAALEEVDRRRASVPAGVCTRAAVSGKQVCVGMTPRERRVFLTGLQEVSTFCSAQVRSACIAAAAELGVTEAAASCPRLAEGTRLVVQALARDVQAER